MSGEYVCNIETCVVHRATCRYATGRVLSWPRWRTLRGELNDRACRVCLPGGLPEAVSG